MQNNRNRYLLLIIIVMIAGLASRHIHSVPLWVGDVLWALMIFYIIRWLFVKRPLLFISFVSLVFCYLIEVSQLYQAIWINRIRHTLFGALILGERFEWGDMLCYTAGVGIGVLLQIAFKSRTVATREILDKLH